MSEGAEFEMLFKKGAIMRKLILLSVVALAMPAVSPAQDDMYFVPTKDKVAKGTPDYGMPRDTYYSGSNRSVDEYNRRGSYVQPIDSAGNDIVDFDAVAGVYPDSGAAAQDDYTYTRRMSRFDDYAWSDPYWAGYYAGRSAGWGWYDPWYYGSWYYGLYDPWYSGWYYDPWYYGWAGWHGWHGHWWGHPVVVSHRSGPTGTFNHIYGTGRRPLASRKSGNTFTGGISNRDRVRSSSVRNRTFNASERFGTNRNNNTNTNSVRDYTPSRTNNSSISNRGSFGGSRSGGGFGGGIRSGGGSRGGFGGRR